MRSHLTVRLFDSEWSFGSGVQRCPAFGFHPIDNFGNRIAVARRMVFSSQPIEAQLPSPLTLFGLAGNPTPKVQDTPSDEYRCLYWWLSQAERFFQGQPPGFTAGAASTRCRLLHPLWSRTFASRNGALMG